MIPGFADKLAKLIAISILVAATVHAVVVIQEVVKVISNPDAGALWVGVGAKVAVWVFAVAGALGVLHGGSLGYFGLYLAAVLSVVMSSSEYAFSFIPFERFWLPEPLTIEGQKWLGICLVNLVVMVVLMWCHSMTRMLRYDRRLEELREESKNK